MDYLTTPYNVKMFNFKKIKSFLFIYNENYDKKKKENM